MDICFLAYPTARKSEFQQEHDGNRNGGFCLSSVCLKSKSAFKTPEDMPTGSPSFLFAYRPSTGLLQESSLTWHRRHCVHMCYRSIYIYAHFIHTWIMSLLNQKYSTFLNIFHNNITFIGRKVKPLCMFQYGVI